MAVTINGTTGITTTGDYDAEDNDKILLGTGDDLQIFHDGNNNHIQGTTAGQSIYLKNDYEIQFLTSTNEKQLVTKANGACELYYDNSKKFETTTNGPAVSSGGADDSKLYFLTGNHTTTRLGYVGHSQFGLDVNGGVHIRDAGNSYETMLKTISNGAVELYHNGVKKLETTSSGATVTGNLNLGDNGSVKWGDGNDLNIYHDGSHSYIKDTGTGQLVLCTDSFRVNNAANSENIITAEENGAVNLYYDDSKKLETDSHGCILTDNDSDVQIKLVSSGGTCGYLYGSNNDNVGLLDEDGNWRVRVTQSGYQLYGSNLSDRDLKDNITIVSGTSLDKLNKLVVKSYNWKQTNDGHTDTSQTNVGFIAQEVKEQFPTLVTGTDGNKNMGIDYFGLYAHAIKAIQELSAEVDTLKTKVAALEAHTHE